jgi:hypothetical protein
MDIRFWITTIIVAIILSILHGVLAAEFDYDIPSWHGTIIIILAFVISTIIKKMKKN